MALVEMPHRRLETERAEGPDAADAEHQLLVQAHLAAADVQDVGDRPVLDRVIGDVGVEQEHGHATDLGQPHGDRQTRGREARLRR